MNRPKIISGMMLQGNCCTFGENVVIDVDEEVVLGDRCVIGDNTYFGGRRVEIGDDFFGYSHWNRRLEIGLGRRGEEHAVLKAGSRCTFHDNRIDLSREVTIGDDVGLSPEAAIYTHGYWMSPLEGFPTRHAPVLIESETIVGFRATVLAGASVGPRSVIGAGSVVPAGRLTGGMVYVGVPAKGVKTFAPWKSKDAERIVQELLSEYAQSCRWRGFGNHAQIDEWPWIKTGSVSLNVETLELRGQENELSDDLRWFLFRRGLRFYTTRPFKAIAKRS